MEAHPCANKKKGFEEYMKKLGIAAVSLLVVGIIGYIIFSFLYTPVKGFEVTIENSTEEQVEGIYLTCAGITKDIGVPVVAQHSKTVVKVQPKDYGESTLTLYYKDKQEIVHKQTIIGYFEESYGNGYVRVNIEKIETDGQLKITSKYKFLGLFESDDWS